MDESVIAAIRRNREIRREVFDVIRYHVWLAYATHIYHYRRWPRAR